MESGLVGLRAELQKKRAEASKFGVGQKGIPRQDAAKQSRSAKSFNISNAGVIARAAKDREQIEEEKVTEEKARSILEKKAAMYERLHGGVEALEDDGLNQKYLVNFQKKITDDVMERKSKQEEQAKREKENPKLYKSSKKDEEWVEYTDVLGRTRTCMRKDLPEMVEKDKELSRDTTWDESPEPDLLSDDMRREIQRQKWEAEEDVNAFKKDMHYQDISFDEARVHGTGYLRFSKDEKERKEQLDLLRDLHKETQVGERAKRVAAAKKEKMLQARLEKVRQRKRLKMGLPVKDLEQAKLKTPPASEDEEEEGGASIGPPIPASLQKEEETSREELKRAQKRKHTREWDMGKEGVKSTLSQEEWVLRQREQRNDEFAPPTMYEPNKQRYSKQNSSSSTNAGMGLPYDTETGSQSYSDPDFRGLDREEPSGAKEERRSEYAPPATYEYYGPSSSRRRDKYGKPGYKAMEDAISKGLSNLRKMSDI
ncbi:coiled-coil domain-containing protein 174-like [Penaeus japonicus]|uniref:coiled-coil domain-containing protein 174-like n=1 Tax=Penaeus japonicus TaxID=27405 RepID=UPI001C71212A|nr:coiled-coil domain-containing protein 174-like [Penaeus japonicus]